MAIMSSELVRSYYELTVSWTEHNKEIGLSHITSLWCMTGLVNLSQGK